MDSRVRNTTQTSKSNNCHDQHFHRNLTDQEKVWTFGGGPRQCIGRFLSSMLLRVTIHYSLVSVNGLAIYWFWLFTFHLLSRNVCSSLWRITCGNWYQDKTWLIKHYQSRDQSRTSQWFLLNAYSQSHDSVIITVFISMNGQVQNMFTD
jgi:hypothetical protein